jgi:hypothetical protein
MAKFCPECGEQAANPADKFCAFCGNQIIKPSSNITPSSYKQEESEFDTVQEPEIKIEKKSITATSRLSGLKIEKFLIPNEIVNYATRGSLYVGGEANLKGYVTNNRVIFYAEKSNLIVFKSDRMHEIPLNKIESYRIVEEGLILKQMHLQLNKLRITGDRADILDLYRAIQTAVYSQK